MVLKSKIKFYYYQEGEMLDFDILLSNLKIKIMHKFDYTSDFCKDYKSSFKNPDIIATADENAVLNEKKLVPAAPIEACESLCIYRAIADELPQFNRFVFHGAAIKYNDNAYLFTAPSGTGKTTHVNLWKEFLGEEVEIINGDKPIIHIDNEVLVYGTPWAGKEGYQNNINAPLHAICVLKQSKVNKITKLENSAAIKQLMPQIYMPQNAVALSKTLELLGKLIQTVPIYILECDISEEAFKTSYNGIVKK